MKKLWIAVFVAGVAVTGPQGNAIAQSQSAAKAVANHPRRVDMRAGGFELSPQAASANQIGGASRGVGNSSQVVLYAPHKGQACTLRPSFWWSGDPHASYKFHLQDVQGTLSWDRQVSGTSMTYPSDAPPLQPGKTYLWRVESESSLFGPPAPSALIVVLPQAERARIKAEQAAVKGSGEKAEIDRAQVLYNHRLWYDTLMAYNRLIEANPGNAKLIQMRDSLYRQLPVTRPLAAASHSK